MERRRKGKINNWILRLASVVPQCSWGKQVLKKPNELNLRRSPTQACQTDFWKKITGCRGFLRAGLQANWPAVKMTFSSNVSFQNLSEEFNFYIFSFLRKWLPRGSKHLWAFCTTCVGVNPNACPAPNRNEILESSRTLPVPCHHVLHWAQLMPHLSN